MIEKRMTQKQVLEHLGMNQHTFTRYAQRLGIKGEKDGRCTMYLRSDIERMNQAFGDRVPLLIRMLEQLTGGKVTITMPE